MPPRFDGKPDRDRPDSTRPGRDRTPPGLDRTPPGLDRSPPGRDRLPPRFDGKPDRDHPITPPGRDRTPPGRDRNPDRGQPDLSRPTRPGDAPVNKPRRPGNRHHHHHTYTEVSHVHGIFVYGPRPDTHHHYVYQNGPVQVRDAHLPTRAIDRSNSLALGLRGGSLFTGTDGGDRYSDLGVGLAARYRPAESMGLEVAVQHHDQSWAPGTQRSQTLMSGSVELFAWPWTRVSPYVLGGLTYTARDMHQHVHNYGGVDQIKVDQPLIGPHAGLGLELALGKSVALDLEGRYIGYLNASADDPTKARGLTATAGLMVHF